MVLADTEKGLVVFQIQSYDTWKPPCLIIWHTTNAFGKCIYTLLCILPCIIHICFVSGSKMEVNAIRLILFIIGGASSVAGIMAVIVVEKR